MYLVATKFKYPCQYSKFMIDLFVVLLMSVIVAAVLFAILKKAVKLSLYVGLVVIVFIVIGNFVLPETDFVEKGKSYIVEKSESAYEENKDKVTAFVIAEANQTVNKVREVVGGK